MLLPFFPVVLLVTNPVRIIKTLWSARVLANGKWSEYNRFRPENGINSLFYWTEAINFDRFGRDGVSPYHLGNWWFTSLTSTYLYWRIGAMLPLLSMFAWLVMHFLWLGQANIEVGFFYLTIMLAFVSSYFYGGAFVFLNYNALGWVFMPLGLFGLITQNYWIAGMAWLAASLGSFTVVFIAGCLSLVVAVFNQTLWPLTAILPAVIKLATHFLFVENFKESLLRVASAIGVLSKKSVVKYTRPKGGHLFSIESLYFTATWGAYSALLYSDGHLEMAMLCLTVQCLWIVNARISRFADHQSIYMAMFSVAMAALILQPSILLCVLFLIAASPIPVLIGVGDGNRNLLNPKSFFPFHVSPLIERTNELFFNVPKDSRVLLALDNPNGQYYKIFDGYRANYEVAFYSGNLNCILVFPDWWAVFENNSTDSPEFWGREPVEVLENLNRWDAGYVLIYQDTQTELNEKWKAFGFDELSQMDWGDLIDDYLDGERCWQLNMTAPKWFLLKAPASSLSNE